MPKTQDPAEILTLIEEYYEDFLLDLAACSINHDQTSNQKQIDFVLDDSSKNRVIGSMRLLELQLLRFDMLKVKLPKKSPLLRRVSQIKSCLSDYIRYI